MSSRLIGIAAIAVVAGAGAFLALRSGSEDAPDQGSTATAVEEAAEKPVKPLRTSDTVKAPKPQPKKKDKGPSRRLLLPDGTTLPSLNNVVNPPPVDWPRGRDWSPVKRKVVDKQGVEWYEHEDGSFTTTQLLYRSDLGRADAITNTFVPEAVAQPDFDK